ncbi:hypothetical protein G7046_g8690 [Stylonectria norvegica]|nr:hypothetical protein G7046_g8690 [Stylonectria norvegica]
MNIPGWHRLCSKRRVSPYANQRHDDEAPTSSQERARRRRIPGPIRKWADWLHNKCISYCGIAPESETDGFPNRQPFILPPWPSKRKRKRNSHQQKVPPPPSTDDDDDDDKGKIWAWPVSLCVYGNSCNTAKELAAHTHSHTHCWRAEPESVLSELELAAEQRQQRPRDPLFCKAWLGQAQARHLGDTNEADAAALPTVQRAPLPEVITGLLVNAEALIAEVPALSSPPRLLLSRPPQRSIDAHAAHRLAGDRYSRWRTPLAVMVRIIPARLKSSSSFSSTNNSRSTSPLRSSKMDSVSPSRDTANGLALKVVILKCVPRAALHQPIMLRIHFADARGNHKNNLNVSLANEVVLLHRLGI